MSDEQQAGATGPTPLKAILVRWRTLPPLVRASAACSAALACAGSARRHAEWSEDEASLGLTRRPRVTAAFVDANAALTDLLVVLANEADAEAVERGYDLDTAYVLGAAREEPGR